MMLYKLLRQINRGEFESEVISLTTAGPVADKIKALGVPVTELGMKRGKFYTTALVKLTLILRERKPDLVQTWLYHSDLAGGISAKMAGNLRTFWSIRQSNIDIEHNKKSTVWAAKTCAKLSARLPEKIICCSHSALKTHVALGYDADKMLVIPNGFDLDAFQTEKDARNSVREELGLDEDIKLVGLVARFDPQKDHRNFIEAAAMVCKNDPGVHFLLCGEGISSDNTPLMQWIKKTGTENSFHLLGIRTDISRLLSSLDVSVSSSLGEGFPNVVGEAMSCAVPCVVTDVGDSALIVGDTGKIVPPRNPEALSSAITELLQATPGYRKTLGKQARMRIEEKFSIQSVAKRFESAYRVAIND